MLPFFFFFFRFLDFASKVWSLFACDFRPPFPLLGNTWYTVPYVRPPRVLKATFYTYGVVVPPQKRALNQFFMAPVFDCPRVNAGAHPQRPGGPQCELGHRGSNGLRRRERNRHLARMFRQDLAACRHRSHVREMHTRMIHDLTILRIVLAHCGRAEEWKRAAGGF